MQRSIRYIKNTKGQLQTYARLRYEDSNGETRDILRKADNKTHAKQILVKLESLINETGTKQFEAGMITYKQLAEYCKKDHYYAATYDEHGAKTGGVRSMGGAHSCIDMTVRFFGTRDIKKITWNDLKAYKKQRLSQCVERGGPRGKKISLATVNREMTHAKAMFNIAITNEWLTRNPFSLSKEKLIQTSAEKKSERVLTDEEEQALFAALQHPDRLHTIPLFIALLDTGARLSSLIEHLRWKHIHFERETLTLTTYKDTNIKQWEVPIPQRLKSELLKLKLQTGAPAEGLVLETATVNRKKIWNAVRVQAGIKDTTLTTLRHTTGTRLAASSVDQMEVARILGHSDPKTTYRYFNLNKKTMDKVRSALDNYNAAVAAS